MSQETNYQQQITNSLQDGYDNVADTINTTKNSFNETVENFSKSLDDVSKPYLQSNTVIAKFAFLIFIIILFVFLLRIGIWLLIYFLSPGDSPFVVKGLLSGGEKVIVSSDPKDANSVPIFRSNNENTGLEFTWSTWLNINDVPADNVNRHIFSKGNDQFDSNGKATVNNSPGLYLTRQDVDDASVAQLHVVMDTVLGSDPNITLDIDNIPIKNWVHVAIRMKNTILDVYVNGTIAGRIVLDHVPKQNYHPVIVNGSDNNFSGSISDLRYFNRALDVFEINAIVANGPNLTSSNLSSYSQNTGYFTYLSNMWYTSKL